LGTWGDPPVYRHRGADQHAIHFRCAEPPTAPNNIRMNWLERVRVIEDADALYDEYAARGVEFTRTPANIAMALA